jgi:hypothetical protein
MSDEQSTAQEPTSTPKLPAPKRCDPISTERQAELQGMLDAWDPPGADHGDKKGPFDKNPGEQYGVWLTGAEVFWLADRVRRLNDLFPDLNLSSVPDLHLEGAYLREAHLKGAHLHEAHLDGAVLSGAHLEGAQLRPWQPRLRQLHQRHQIAEATRRHRRELQRLHRLGVFPHQQRVRRGQRRRVRPQSQASAQRHHALPIFRRLRRDPHSNLSPIAVGEGGRAVCAGGRATSMSPGCLRQLCHSQPIGERHIGRRLPVYGPLCEPQASESGALFRLTVAVRAARCHTTFAV